MIHSVKCKGANVRSFGSVIRVRSFWSEINGGFSSFRLNIVKTFEVQFRPIVSNTSVKAKVGVVVF